MEEEVKWKRRRRKLEKVEVDEEVEKEEVVEEKEEVKWEEEEKVGKRKGE